MGKRDIFIGGAWPYANYYLHVGHLAALLPGDVIAKYYRACGDNVFYVSGSDWENDISAHFADTHYVFPNGTRIPAFEMFLYPEPAFLDWEG